MAADLTRGWGVVLLAACAVAAILVQAALPILVHPTLPAPMRPTATASNSAIPDPSIPRVSIQPILDFQPFGTVEAPEIAAAAPEPDPVLAPLPEPDLPVDTDSLALQGILQFDDPSLSRAMISINGGPAQGFAPGDTLPDGSTVARIEANAVWINRNGDEVTLAFRDDAAVEAADQEVTVQTGQETVMQGEGASQPAILPPDPNTPVMPTGP